MGLQDIEPAFARLRCALEDALSVHPPEASRVDHARADLLVNLVSFSTHEFDLEARFHADRLDTNACESTAVAIARSLVAGDTNAAFKQFAASAASADHPETLLRLAFSALVRSGASCPELPWLKVLLARIQGVVTRGAAAAELIARVPAGSATRRDLATVTVECVAALWEESPAEAAWLTSTSCHALVDGDDQLLLAWTSAALLRSLPAGNTEERNTLGFLLVSSLQNSGDVAGSVKAMEDLLDALGSETWEPGNFSLLTSIAASAAQAGTTAINGTDIDLAMKAVALADRAFGMIEQHGWPVEMADDDQRETQHTLNAKFSEVATTVRMIAEATSLEVAQPDPLPIFRFRDQAAEPSSVSHPPNRSARISEARFLEECARVDWKAIPTPLEIDYGIDYRVEIPDSPGKRSSDVEFLVQLKSTGVKPNRSGLLTVSIDEATLKYWKSKVLPTLVVLFHHQTDAFYTAWYLPALDDAMAKTFRFAREDEWDPITLQNDVRRYYTHVRAALASGGDWSVLSTAQLHCALLVKMMLSHEDVRRAALDDDADLGASEVDILFLTWFSMNHRALSSPLPILGGETDTENVARLMRTLNAIVRSWTLGGPQTSEAVSFHLVSRHGFWKSCRDMLHVAVELDCALCAAIVEAQERRAAALAGGSAEQE